MVSREIAQLLGTDALLNYQQAAMIRSITVKTLRNYIASGRLDIKTYSIGNKKYLKRDDLIQAIEREKQKKAVYQPT